MQGWNKNQKCWHYKSIYKPENSEEKTEKKKAELDTSLEESNLSWFGNVSGGKDGDIEVAWADGMVSKPLNTQKWMKKVQQKWNILKKNLPGTIFGRIYEDRMDLLRAVIVGAAGTPYQDGTFFFDIHFPSNYPDVPPVST